MTDPAFPAAPFRQGERIELQPTPLAVIRQDGIRMANVPPLFDRGYTTLGGLFATGALRPVGPAVAIYHGDPGGVFDLEIGFPVAEAPAEPIAAGEMMVVGSTLPAGQAAAGTYLGPYDGLGAAWGALIGASGAVPSGVWIESYVGDPGSTAPDELRTDLILPVRG